MGFDRARERNELRSVTTETSDDRSRPLNSPEPTRDRGPTGGETRPPTVQGNEETLEEAVDNEEGRPNVPLNPDANPGRPINPRLTLEAKVREGAAARVNAITELFGDDAFVLQHLFFKVPPLSIKIRKQNINYKWKSLRTKDVTIAPSGHGECYIDVPFVFIGERELKTSLQELIKVFKLAPFAFIENKFIRDMMIPDRPEDSMAACLETLHMQAVTGRPDAVSANLGMKWFNYKPYSNHFWFRKDWRSVVDQSSENADSTDEPSSTSMTDSIVDMTEIENIENLDLAYPPEFRIPTTLGQGDNADPAIARTQPVVYPFNSQAFLSYLQSYDQENYERSFEKWNDQLTMGWNSYARVPWPRNILSVDTGSDGSPGEDSQPSRRTRGDEPTPVSGDRNIVLFVGDSISVGYLRLRAAKFQQASHDATPPELTDVSTQIRDIFRQQEFEFYSIAKVGANSNTLKGKLVAAMNDSTFASRVAGVIIACGANDGPGLSGNLETVENVKTMAEAVTRKEAIAVVLPIWPIQDPVRGDVHEGKTVDFPDTWKATVSQRNTLLRGAVSGLGDRAVFRNPHVAEITTDPNSWNGLWLSQFRQVSGNEINVHPNPNGYAAIANVVYGLLPWRAFAGEAVEQPVEPEEIIYSVQEVLDGDTIRVTGPEGNFTVRMLYIDAPEIGQPTWGHNSKTYLQSIIGEEVTLRISEGETYGRKLAVVYSFSGLNLNLEMIKAGQAVVYRRYANEGEQAEYYAEEVTAKGSSIGVWSEGGQHQQPWEWRRVNDRNEEI